MRKAPKPRKQAFTPEILDLFRRAHAMWMPAHAHVIGDEPEDEELNREWNGISTRLRRLLDLGPWAERVESPFLDHRCHWREGQGGALDWSRCQRIRPRP